MLEQGGFGALAVVGFLVLYSRDASWNLIYAWLAVALVPLPLRLSPNVNGSWLGFLHGARGRRT